MKDIGYKMKKQIEQYRRVKAQELTEARKWIAKGKSGVNWHWDNPQKQEVSLETSFDFFLSKTDQRTDDAIVHFVGQEIYDLWNQYPDDNLTNRCNHAKSLYNYITSRLKDIEYERH